jgi:hypothetical protein
MRSAQLASVRPSTVVGRCLFLLAVVASLTAGVAGGLLRAGATLPEQLSGAWVSQAIVAHAFLMICTFMGTVIGIERAVAAKRRFAFAAPATSGAAGLLMLSGFTAAAAWLSVVAGLVFVAVNALVVRRQRAPHTALLLVAAITWLIGNLLFAADTAPQAVVAAWFSFLVLTIAAERLEMTRLMRRRRGASRMLYAILGAMLLGCAASAPSPAWGGVLYGASLLCLAAWLLCFDIARRTVRAHGLSRYMAVCLLLGYFWLAVAGVAWCATAIGFPFRDAALHALGLGFVLSMMLGHAPVILPALARVKLLFGRAFYVPLALLHLSVALRLLGGHVDADLLAAGATGNALSILLFAATVGGAAIAWRLKSPPLPAPSDDDVAVGH